jgi:hypothetical protein
LLQEPEGGVGLVCQGLFVSHHVHRFASVSSFSLRSRVTSSFALHLGHQLRCYHSRLVLLCVPLRMASTQAKPMSEKQRLKLEKFANKKETQAQQQQQQTSGASKEKKSKKQDVPAVERLGRGDASWTEKDLETIGRRLPQGLLTQGRRICLVQLLGGSGTFQATNREGWQPQAKRQIRYCHPAAQCMDSCMHVLMAWLSANISRR